MSNTFRLGRVRIDLINLTLFLSLFTIFLQQTFGVSGLIYFFIDIPIVAMLMKKNGKIIKDVLNKNMLSISVVLILSAIAAFIGSTINHPSLANVIYGYYKHFRGFFYFVCVYSMTNDKSVQSTKIIFRNFFIINVIFTLFQFFVLHLNQDRLGGVFGTIAGVNQYTNLFFLIISIYCLFHIVVLRDKDNNKKYILLLLTMLLIAAMAEIKYFFAEMLILIFVSLIFTRRKLKAAIALVAIFIGLIISYRLLIRMFPEYSILLTALRKGGISRLISLQQHYSTDVDMGRAVVFSYPNKYFLTSNIKRMFGLGIGSITSSSFVNNSFWIRNSASHYDQFSTAYLYIEQGIVGFILYVLFYVILLVRGIKFFVKKKRVEESILLIMVVISTFLVFVYNNVLFSQICFLNYWVLATIFKKLNMNIRYCKSVA